MKETTIAIDLAKSVFEIGISDRPAHRPKQASVAGNWLSLWPHSRRRPSLWKPVAPGPQHKPILCGTSNTDDPTGQKKPIRYLRAPV